MEVIISEKLGFCYGVKRAYNLVLDTLKREKERIYTFGNLIHNPQVVKKLTKQGIKSLNKVDELKSRIVVIPSHGTSPKFIEKIKKNNNKIIDATCPHVKNVQELAKKIVSDGYQLVIIGDRSHPEVKAILDSVGGKAIVIRDFREIDEFNFKKKIGVISQTTKSLEDFQEAVSYLVKKTFEIKIYNTICKETIERIKSSLALAKKVDIMIVIGGKNSSNTTSLAKTLKRFIKTYHIETKEDLRKKWFKNKNKVGITAGASTPDWIIKEVIGEIKKYE